MGRLQPQDNEMPNFRTLDSQGSSLNTKAIAISVGGSIAAAVTTMFIPTGLLEAITGASGLSEIVHATAAPLGDTARTLIAFAVGSLTLIVLMAVTMRQPAASKEATIHASQSAQAGDFNAPRTNAQGPNTGTDSETKQARGFQLPRITLPKMPWAPGEDDISDLADLRKLQTPKLRPSDSHPDAPPRRPISALVDLADTDNPPVTETEPQREPIMSPQPAEQSSVPAAPVWQGPPAETRAMPEHFAANSASHDGRFMSPPVAEPVGAQTPGVGGMTTVAEVPTLAEMVAQMEAAVEQRKQQLAELETVAAEILAMKSAGEYSLTPTQIEAPAPAPAPAAKPRFTVPQPETIRPYETSPAYRPPLEVVSSQPQPAPAADRDMDAALNAALETLQRMNR